MDAVILALEPCRTHLIARSERSLRAAGAVEVHVITPGAAVPGVSGPVILLRAGAWLRFPGRFSPPPFHPAGHPLIAIGHPVGPGPAQDWQVHFDAFGGDFTSEAPFPPCICEWLDETAVTEGWLNFRAGEMPLPAQASLRPPRRFHWSPLDAGYDPGLRCLQIVTSLQHGGAEKIAWGLARELPHAGVATRLVTLGKPLRRTLPPLPGTVDLSPFDRGTRAERLALVAHHFGADVLHGHLIDAEDMRLFVKGGIPLAITIHNTRAAWPSGLAGLQPGDASLLIACAQKVEEELATAQLAIPLRTAWNGIDVIENPAQIPLPPPTAPAGEWVLACVANPRRQKRLHLLPAILAATIRELTSRGQPSAVRLILAGEASPKSPEAQDCYRELHEEAIRCGVQNFIEWTDGDRPPTDVYAHAHAAISCSAYEGLSLAHMEALAAGLPLITTDAGGTRELAPGNPAMTLLPVETSPETFASAIVNALTTRGTTGRPAIERDFSSTQLAGRTRWLLQRAADHAAVPIRKGVLFVTNNFSTGGAQSSLRRLAIGLHSQGIPVRIALLQEYEEHPTPGTTALREEGLEMIVLPPAGRTTAPAAVELLLGDLAATPPATVVFWNAIPVYKILIADALWGARIFDVSPGEMFFSSLDRYFANPLPGLPYRSYEDYGRRLSSVIVKFNGEAALARSLFHIPVQVIPNGIAVPESPAEVIPRPPGAPLAFGTSARISLQKRLEDLLEAFRLALSDLPGCTLVIAGAAEQESVAYSRSLQQAATDLPVTWLGEVIGMDAFLRSLDVFVMISEPAGCPNASLEALAIGLPVIATDHGGTKEQVLPGRTGLLVPHRDPRALADAMIDLYRHPEERTRLGAAGRAHVAGQFSLEVMIRRYRELIEQAECPAE